ncbi:MAG: hypothetical protein JW860_09530 [Sedimentisphaerales bacterium]|nr:hypothetical protein [Sedimentisphaerales bacterium]
MGPILSSLVELQAIESRVRDTKKELEKGQQVLKKQLRRIQQLKSALETKREDIKLSRMQCDKLEVDLKSKDEELTRLRVTLNTAKTNKEYSAILTRINTDKADNSKLEDQILALISQIESDQKECKEIEENIEIETQRLDEIQEEIEEKQGKIQAKLDKFEAERLKAFSKVSDKHGYLFDRLADRYDGEVLAEVAQANGVKGDYSCRGCFMKVPLEVANSLMTRDDVIACPNCGRILVLDMNPKQQATS